MSHYTVLCITHTDDEDELEKMLAPYEENLQLEWVADPDTENGGYYHNPRAKWDWWTVGGRWSNELLTLSGDKVDRCRRDQLAIDAMRADALDQAVSHWEATHRAAVNTPVALTWGELRLRHGDDFAAVREEFWAQPRVIALKAIDDWNTAELLDDYQVHGREAVIQRAVAGAVPGYATLTHEAWIGKGEMGWFGMGSDTHESAVRYFETVNKVIDDLPASAWLTIVDCHI